MANILRDEDLRLNVIVNGNQARKELGELSEDTRKLTDRNKELRKEKALLRAEGKKDSAYYKDISKEMKANDVAIKNNEASMKKYKTTLGLTGMTIKELNKEAKLLRTTLANTVPKTAQWKAYNTQLAAVNKQIAVAKGQSVGFAASMGKLGDSFNRYLGLVTAATAVIYGMVAAVSELISGNARLSDSYADVAKTTGMTVEEVKELAAELKKIDTRTARSELLEMSYMAGKLGITGKKNVAGFVEAADKINVALGKDLGGSAEEAVKQIGKLVDIFGIEDKHGLNEGMVKVGSSINAIGMASSASEGYVVEFAKRLAGVAPAANITFAEIAGLAGALDSLGQTSEVSSTVFAQVIPKMFTDTAEFANIANMELDDFTKLLNEDANEAMIRFLEGLGANNAGIGEMATKLDGLGFSGKKSIAVLGVMAKNTEELRRQQTIANEEFEKGTSLQEEFAIKNTNFAASLDKIKKSLAGIFINSSLMNGLDSLVKGFERWLRVPLSQHLEQERIELNMLEIKIQDTNISQEERVKLINELKEAYPEYLGHIDAETVTNNELSKSIEKVNDMLINKIILQKEDENIAEKSLTQAEKQKAFWEKEEALLAKVVELKEKQGVTLTGSVGSQAQYLVEALAKDKSQYVGMGSDTYSLNQAYNDYIIAQSQLTGAKGQTQSALKQKQDLMKKLNPQGSMSTTDIEKLLWGNTNTSSMTEAELNAYMLENVFGSGGIATSTTGGKGGNDDAVEAERLKYEDFNKVYQEHLLKKEEISMEWLKQSNEIAINNRAAQYETDLAALGDNEDAKAELTQKYREDELMHQQAYVQQSLNIAKQEAKKLQDKDGLSSAQQSELNQTLVNIAQLEYKLAELNGKTVDLKLKVNGKPITYDYNYLGVDNRTKKQKINDSEQQDYDTLNKQFGFTGSEDKSLMYGEELLMFAKYESLKVVIANEAAKRRQEIAREEFFQFADMLGSSIDSIAKIKQAASDNEISKVRKDAQAEYDILTQQLDSGIITIDEYNARKVVLKI